MKLTLGIFLFLVTCSVPTVVLPALLPVSGTATVTPMGAGGQVIVNGLRPLFPEVPPGGYPDPYPQGQCTWWVAYNRQVPATMGDGWMWLGSGAAAGMATSDQPSVGAIVVYRASPGYDTVHGHVAIVIAVGQGFFRVSEMNVRGLGVVDERDSPWPDWHVEGFLPR